MVYSDNSIKNFCSSKIVYCEVRTPLIFILKERKAFWLAGLLIADKVDKGGFAKLWEDGNYVAFGEFEGKSAYVDVCSISIIGMPGGIWTPEKRLLVKR